MELQTQTGPESVGTGERHHGRSEPSNPNNRVLVVFLDEFLVAVGMIRTVGPITRVFDCSWSFSVLQTGDASAIHGSLFILRIFRRLAEYFQGLLFDDMPVYVGSRVLALLCVAVLKCGGRVTEFGIS